MGRALNLFPISPPASHIHKLFTPLQRSHELLISNLVSPSNMFTYSIAILVHLLDTQGCLWPLSQWLPSLPQPRARCHSGAEPLSLALWETWKEFARSSEVKLSSKGKTCGLCAIPGRVSAPQGMLLPVLIWICCSKAAP